MNESISESKGVSPAREAAVDALVVLARRGPGHVGGVRTGGLSERDARLAEAIYRTAVERWLTLERVVTSCLTQGKVEPGLMGVLMAGAAQVVFMDRVPVHAAVDEAVEQAKRRVREKAGGLVNAVLRRVSDMVLERTDEGGWEPGNNCVPWRDGSVQLAKRALIKAKDGVKYLSLATSHDRRLVEAWVEGYGEDAARVMLCHSLVEPTVWLNTPSGMKAWEGGELSGVLADGESWVQDVTAAKVGEVIGGLGGGVVVDFCAGMGTKTRHIERVLSGVGALPGARIVATDVDAERMGVLEGVFAERDRVEVLPMARVEGMRGEADVVLVDVPCSNSGVLARRPEAKYRFGPRHLDSLERLQREVVSKAVGLVKDGGVLVYSTCSVEERENRAMAAWACETFELTLERDEQTLPGGEGETYRDGGYWAVLRKG